LLRNIDNWAKTMERATAAMKRVIAAMVTVAPSLAVAKAHPNLVVRHPRERAAAKVPKGVRAPKAKAARAPKAAIDRIRILLMTVI
jgi:hypothetical protein